MNERRLFPRYPLNAEYRIFSRHEQHFTVEANEISKVGISLKISDGTMTGLANDGISLEIGNKFDLVIPATRFPASEMELNIPCQIKHVRRLSQQLYLIGAWFRAKRETEFAEIDALVENASKAMENYQQ